MKKKIILTTIVSLFLAAAVQAQPAKSNFAGGWELDAAKSTLPEQMRVDSMTLKVTQTDKELMVETAVKRAKNEMRGAMRGIGAGGAPTAIYNLEGKEMTDDLGSGIMAGKETRRAAMTADGKLNLNIVRSFKSEMGGATMKTNEIWELLAGGKTLKVTRYMETPRGAVNAEMLFTRTTPIPAATVGSGETYQGSVAAGDTVNVPKKISGGVLNGKAVSLPKPEYPDAAKAVRASGAVNVQVTVDEQGNIISASAVSGHPLLRQAAEQAAREAKFAPTMLQGVPVSVTGVLVYNFVP